LLAGLLLDVADLVLGAEELEVVSAVDEVEGSNELLRELY
jgi:hypothetical protein